MGAWSVCACACECVCVHISVRSAIIDCTYTQAINTRDQSYHLGLASPCPKKKMCVPAKSTNMTSADSSFSLMTPSPSPSPSTH